MISKSLAKALIFGAGTTVVLGIAVLVLVPDARVMVVRPRSSDACVTEELKTITNLSGMKFEITYESCDTLAKEESVTVYVSQAVAGKSLLSRWLNRRAAIFSYDPFRYDDPPPSVQASGKDRILISVPRVSSVTFRYPKWRNVSIDYNIGHIYYETLK